MVLHPSPSSLDLLDLVLVDSVLVVVAVDRVFVGEVPDEDTLEDEREGGLDVAILRIRL